MAGPSLSGPLTGWTASSLAPRTAAVVAAAPAAPTLSPVTNLPEFAGQFGAPTPEVLAEVEARRLEQEKAAIALEADARATNDPVKLRRAYELAVGAAGMKNWRPGQTGQTREGLVAAKAFRDRNPTIETLLSTRGKALLNNPLPEAGAAPAPIAPVISAAAPTFQSLQAAGSGGPSAYNLSDSDFGGLGPNPRTVVKPQTALESLLSAIYPDAAASGGGVTGDPRNPQQPSVINNVLANLSATPGPQSGYVPAPALIGAAPAGAQIASTIPGAPPFLAGAINNVNTAGGFGFAGAPVAAARPAVDLASIAAISAEQRIQEAARLKAEADRQAQYFAQLQAQQRAQQQADQIARQKAGVAFSQSGWQSPTFKPAAWTPSFPTF